MEYKVVCPDCGNEEFFRDGECTTEGCDYVFVAEQYDFVKSR